MGNLNKDESQPLEFPNARHIYAHYYNIRGANYAHNGKIEEALESFNKAIELNPLYALAFFNRATIKTDLGDFEGARKDFHLAKSIDVENDCEPALSTREYLQDEI